MDRLLASCSAHALWTAPAFPGRWRVQRWAQAHAGAFRGRPPRHIARGDFGFVVTPEASLDVYLNGLSAHPPIERILREHVRPGQHVLDIGGNIGWTARLMSMLVGASGSVTAFEPVPAARANLQLNADAAPARNIRVRPEAASDSAGEVDIHLGAEQETALATLRRPEPGAAGRTLRIRTLTVDSLLPELPTIAFAKIDVEGAEYKVLTGMAALIARDRPVLAIELSDAWLRRMGDSAQVLVARLRGQGYRVMTPGAAGLLPLDTVPAEQVDIVCLPQGVGAS